MAKKSPYLTIELDKLTLRDYLAVDRTIAANERTLLGYIRTSLALLAGGGSLLHFFEEFWLVVLGLCMLLLSPPLLFFGVYHFVTRRRSLAPLMHVGETRANQRKAPSNPT